MVFGLEIQFLNRMLVMIKCKKFLSGSIISLFMVYHTGISSIKTKKPVRHFVRAFSAVGCVVLYIFGIKYLLLSENIAIAHSAPIIAALLALPILGEKIGIHRKKRKNNTSNWLRSKWTSTYWNFWRSCKNINDGKCIKTTN